MNNNYHQNSKDYDRRGKVGCLVITAILILLLALSACVSTKPSQRGIIKTVVTRVQPVIYDTLYRTTCRIKKYYYSAVINKKHAIGDTLTLKLTTVKADSIFKMSKRKA